MKILLVNKFHYIKGGSETYYFSLGDLLEKRGHPILWFSMQDERNLPCAQSEYFVDHVDFNASGHPMKTAEAALHLLYSREAGRKFARLLDDEKPDIVHLNIFQSQLTGSIVEEAYKRHIPMVYTAHDLKSVCPNYLMMHHGKTCEKCLDGHYWHCFANGCMKSSRAKSLLASMESYVYKHRKTYRKIDYVITPSLFYKKELEASGVFGCPIEHVRNFLPAGTAYEAGGRGSYFLYFGRLSGEKGIRTLIEAFGRAQVEEKLYIVGSGPEESALRELVKRLGMEDRILFLGFKTGSELKEIVANALCVCLPSEWYENGPYSILEAQALGRPAIVSDYGGLPELVEDGRTGYIAKAGDVSDLAEKIRKMSRSQMDSAYISGKAARAYSADLYAEHIVGIYKKLIP
ncbi:MAG: glycosyltransferase [Clostridia bacterium]|nr:glycosyltransferase [Clostridia bacterium]MBR6860320.1 glycosyltransferase [Acidaminococcaceae bacterium]